MTNVSGPFTIDTPKASAAAAATTQSKREVRPYVPLTDVVAELRAAGRRYRFFLDGETRNTNAADAFRKVCGLSRSETPFNLAADETDVHGPGGHDIHEPAAVPSVSRLKWNAVVDAGARPFEDCAALMHGYRNATARRIETLVKQLPVYPWAVAVKGTGPMNLGLIIGELGDPSVYANPAKVWKRMGLAVVDGAAHRRKKGVLTDYSPVRRTIMHNLGESLLRRNEGIYKAAYDTRKAYERERDPAILLIVAHKRAMRYMEKLWLKHLWQEWRKAIDTATPVP
jgi:hypothetical protein